ncbi:MAG: RsbRD N-terminal domain-containing protein [Chitinispirillia bacterium]
MELRKYLLKERKKIVKKWYDLVIDTYPSDTAKFLVNTKDPFANPVGSNIKKGLEDLFDELVKDEIDHENITKCLDPILRIRAIQNFTPIEAMEFVFWLKRIIRKTLINDMGNPDILKQLLEFELRIDTMGMIAFGIYVGCKETLYSIRSNQTISKAYKTFKRAGLLKEYNDEK